jgi:hypothetical protein
MATESYEQHQFITDNFHVESWSEKASQGINAWRLEEL